MTNYHWGIVVFIWISQEMLKMPILDGFENDKIQLQLYLPGANDVGTFKISPLYGHIHFLTAWGPLLLTWFNFNLSMDK